MKAFFSKPMPAFVLPQNTESRTYGSCISVVAENGRVLGHVYKETVVNEQGLLVRNKWHAHKEGSRVFVLEYFSTRLAAAERGLGCMVESVAIR